jgi:hypothetical protein
MSEPYRGRRSGRSAAFPNLWARQSHPRVDGLDPATPTTRDFDNRASCLSLDSTTASYQEALLPCTRTRHRQLTRTRPLSESNRPHGRIENGQLGTKSFWRGTFRSDGFGDPVSGGRVACGFGSELAFNSSTRTAVRLRSRAAALCCVQGTARRPVLVQSRRASCVPAATGQGRGGAPPLPRRPSAVRCASFDAAASGCGRRTVEVPKA